MHCLCHLCAFACPRNACVKKKSRPVKMSGRGRGRGRGGRTSIGGQADAPEEPITKAPPPLFPVSDGKL